MSKAKGFIKAIKAYMKGSEKVSDIKQSDAVEEIATLISNAVHAGDIDRIQALFHVMTDKAADAVFNKLSIVERRAVRKVVVLGDL